MLAEAGRIEIVGGHPAVDLVNTVAWRLDPSRAADRLVDIATLAKWAVAAGVADEATERAIAQGHEAVLRDVRAVREAVYALLHPIALGVEPPESVVRRIHGLVRTALSRARVVQVVPWRWDVPIGSAADVPPALALQAWRLLEEEDLRRLKECQDDCCGWLFLDRSKNASRRWCSSADCGNRDRVRRFEQRRREA